MPIVDAQVHIWGSGPPTTPTHRQVEAFSADELLREMDEAGVDAAVLHPPGWDPGSHELALEAVRRQPAASRSWAASRSTGPRVARLSTAGRASRDLTRMPCPYRQVVTMFAEELSWLRGRDEELVMGDAICAWLDWRPTV